MSRISAVQIKIGMKREGKIKPKVQFKKTLEMVTSIMGILSFFILCLLSPE